MNRAASRSRAGGMEPIANLRPHPGLAQFARRAHRLRALAEGRSLADFLTFCAELSVAQSVAAAAVTIPEDGRERPPIRPIDASCPLGSQWLDVLRTIMAELASTSMPLPARAGLARLAHFRPEDVSAFASRILSSEIDGPDLAAAPFVAAALQVQFAARAAVIRPSEVECLGAGGCPLCGCPPVAGLVLGDERLRYLACALCGTEWYLPRIKCAHCASTASIAYFSLEGLCGVKAEVCDACGRYLKLFYLDERPTAEASADDLATFPVDVLVSEKGYRKAGINLFLTT